VACEWPFLDLLLSLLVTAARLANGARELCSRRSTASAGGELRVHQRDLGRSRVNRRAWGTGRAVPIRLSWPFPSASRAVRNSVLPALRAQGTSAARLITGQVVPLRGLYPSLALSAIGVLVCEWIAWKA
jgi:hypothetical protein